MELTTITMDPAEAAERAEAYRRLAVPSIEEKEILAGFLALASGKQIIRLSDTIVSGGCDADGWPRLAVMRADQRWCWLSVSRRSAHRYNATTQQHEWAMVGVDWEFAYDRYPHANATRMTFAFAGPTIEDAKHCHWGRRAMVPPVPPDLRPTHRGRMLKLDNFLVLWEVEQWEAVPRPPGDPALLRHVAADLYSVEAIWDLTELEQAVLAGRNTR